jgi:hypothetical protein
MGRQISSKKGIKSGDSGDESSYLYPTNVYLIIKSYIYKSYLNMKEVEPLSANNVGFQNHLKGLSHQFEFRQKWYGWKEKK